MKMSAIVPLIVLLVGIPMLAILAMHGPTR